MITRPRNILIDLKSGIWIAYDPTKKLFNDIRYSNFLQNNKILTPVKLKGIRGRQIDCYSYHNIQFNRYRAVLETRVGIH